jgi:tagatose 1,6-diphosphate aldolase
MANELVLVTGGSGFIGAHCILQLLSAGVSNPVFIETLELANESGTSYNGVLCGRATWKDGIKIYATKGAKAFEEWLNTTGVENIDNVNKALAGAHSWHDKVDQHATLHEPVHA